MSDVSHKFTVSTAIASHCSKDSCRYTLAGVQVSPAQDPNEVSLVATDGSRLVATLEEGSATRPAVINGAALKLSGKAPLSVELNGALRVSSTPAKRGAPAIVAEHTGAELEGRFPRVADIFPESIEGFSTIELDCDFLSQLAAAIRPAGDESKAITLAIPPDGNTPAIFQFGGNLGVIMPMDGGKESRAKLYKRALVRHGFRPASILGETPAPESAPVESTPMESIDAPPVAIPADIVTDALELPPAPMETAPPSAPPSKEMTADELVATIAAIPPVMKTAVESAPLPEKTVEKGLSAIWRYNLEKHGIEIRFREAPRVAIRSMLKEAGFRWSSRQELWYAPATDSARTFADEIAFRHDSRAPQWTINASAPVNLTPSAKPAPAPVSENVDAFLAMIGG